MGVVFIGRRLKSYRGSIVAWMRWASAARFDGERLGGRHHSALHHRGGSRGAAGGAVGLAMTGLVLLLLVLLVVGGCWLLPVVVWLEVGMTHLE